jgi:hypothetical protein
MLRHPQQPTDTLHFYGGLAVSVMQGTLSTLASFRGRVDGDGSGAGKFGAPLSGAWVPTALQLFDAAVQIDTHNGADAALVVLDPKRGGAAGSSHAPAGEALRIAFSQMVDVRRRRDAAGGDGVGVDVDFQVADGGSWRGHTAALVSTRGDAEIVDDLFRLLLMGERRARANSSALCAAPPSQLVSSPRMDASASQQQFAVAEAGGQQQVFTGNSSAIDTAAEALEAIRRRRSERQKALVAAMVLGPETDMAHFTGTAPPIAPAGAAQAPTLAPAAGDYGHKLPSTATWCRWCNSYAAEGPIHLNNCPNRVVECSWCGERMPRARFDQHQVRCSARDDALARKALQRRQEEKLAAKSAARVQSLQAAALEEASSDDGGSGGGGSTATDHGRACVWCKKNKPKSHDRTCGKRRVMCGTCHQLVMYVEKDEHRSTCRKAPSRTASNLLASKDSSRRLLAADGTPGSSKQVKFQ